MGMSEWVYWVGGIFGAAALYNWGLREGRREAVKRIHKLYCEQYGHKAPGKADEVDEALLAAALWGAHKGKIKGLVEPD